MNKILKTTVIVMIISVIAKIIGVIQESILGATFGVGYESDIYIMTISMVTSIFAIISPAINSAFMPILIEKKDDINEQNKFINSFITIFFIICSLSSIIGIVFSNIIIQKVFPSLNNQMYFELANKCLRISLLSIGIIGLQSIFTSIFHANGKFVIPSILTIVYNVILSIYIIILSDKFGVVGLCICVVIANLVQWLVHLPTYYKLGYSYRINDFSKDIKRVIKLSIPIMVGVSVSQINVLVDKSLSSYIGVGSMTLMSYANKVNLISFSIIITTITTIYYPKLIELKVNNKIEEYQVTLTRVINIMIVILIPVAFGIIAIKEELITTLFGYGNFTHKDVLDTALILTFLAPSIIAYGVREVLTKAFYSFNDTRTPMYNSIIGITINIILSIGLVGKFKLAGIALATTISSFIIIFIMYRSFQKHIRLHKKDTLRTISKSLIAAVIMYSSLEIINKYIYINSCINMIICIVFGSSIYFIMTIIFKVTEVIHLLLEVTNSIKNRRRNT